MNERLREQVLSAQEQHVFSPRLLNMARAGFSRANFYFSGYVPAAVAGDYAECERASRRMRL